MSDPERAFAINGDLSKRASVRTADCEWQPSPSGTVWRKRLHLVGGAESGQVTSLVRYEARSRFPAHDHPDGEEILVLDGVFSDEHGDWPAGTYLLNPEGFRHAPFSDPGCLLFVKLRQYAGAARHHVELRTREVPWSPSREPGIEQKILYAHADFPDTTRLERWAAGTASPRPERADGAEIFVIEGSIECDGESLGALSWLRIPVGQSPLLTSREGCVIYLKTDALGALRSVSA